LSQVCELNGKESSNIKDLKESHRKKLSLDAELIIALIRKQPQSKTELIDSGISRSSVYRIIPYLEYRGIIKETSEGYSLWNYVGQAKRWDKVVNAFSDAGANLVEIIFQKASDDGVDPVTGWFKFKHDTEYVAKAIIVLRNAPDLIAIAKKFGIRFRQEGFQKREFAGVILTKDSISFMDQFTWQNELYKIWDTEDVMDGYNFSYRVGYLDWLPK